MSITPPERVRRFPAPRLTARVRLTLLYAGMFLVLGTAAIAAIVLLTRTTTHVQVSASPVPGPTSSAPLAIQRTADLNRLWAVSWVVLAITAIASAGLGWLAAGRVLRPLRQMADTARTLSAGNLSRRLAVAGPDDEIKQLGDTLDELLARLEASFAAQRRFVSNAAHELRTPLTLERTLLEVTLADPGATAPTFRAACEELLESGRDQERLLEALLTLASSERGLDQSEPLDLASLAARALDRARHELDTRGLTVSADLLPAPVSGDEALLQRMIANLLDNASQHNVSGGWIELRTAHEGGSSTVTVINTGQAIPADEIQRLFEPFQRLNHDRTVYDGHHGLGLSIVRAIASAHHARIAAAPRADGGMSLSVSFDQATPPAAPTSQSGPGP
jgi:signal transduction histidine kinase